MFAALAAAGVNMKMITTGDIKISVLVDRTDGVKALRAVHKASTWTKAAPGAGQPWRRRESASRRFVAPEVVEDRSRTWRA